MMRDGGKRSMCRVRKFYVSDPKGKTGEQLEEEDVEKRPRCHIPSSNK